MNPLGIFAIILAFVVGYFGLAGSEFSPFGGLGRGPLATGPGRGAEVENPQPVARDGGFFRSSPPPAEVRPGPGESPYKDVVRIVDVRRSGDRPEEEYVTIRYGGGFFGLGGGRSSGEKPINVTGWRVAGTKTSAPIPRAFNIPEIDAAEQDIFLPPGGELIIVTGTPTYTLNFRENGCVGYLNEFHAFTPSLSNSCIDSRPDRSALLARGFNGACIDAIEDIRTCRRPRGPFLADVVKRECIDYMNENFSYAGCVKNFRDRPDFLENTWRVSLKLSRKLYDPRHDRVTLRDQNGLLVDEFEY